MMLLAASSWPLGVLIALPVLGVLLFSAFAFAHNSRQRIANMLLGTLGSVAALIAFVVYVEHVDNRRLEDYIPILAPVTMTVGAVIGVVLSVVIRSAFAVLIDGSACRRAAQQDGVAGSGCAGSPPTDSGQESLEE
jgi:Na+/proline symporter